MNIVGVPCKCGHGKEVHTSCFQPNVMQWGCCDFYNCHCYAYSMDNLKYLEKKYEENNVA